MSFGMNVEYYDFLFDQLKTYVRAKSIYSPNVLKKPISTSPLYPQQVLTEIANADDGGSLNRREVKSILGFEIDTFSTNKIIEGKTVDNLVICRELSKLADDVMFFYGFRRITATPTPTVDTTLYRIVCRYNGRLFNNFNQIL